MPDVGPQDIEKEIKSIQNIAIMLAGAAEFVCKGRILKRFAKDIDANLKRLEVHISSLKRKFPGKLPETLRFESPLSKIRDIATMLAADSVDTEAKCRSGDLGNELNLGAMELKGTVKGALETVHGRVSEYTFTDRIADYGGRLKSFLSALSPIVSYKARVVLATLLVACFSFVYLFVTMESENVLLARIKDDLTYIEQQKDALKRHKREYKEVQKDIKSYEKKKELNRKDKIEYLNLSKKERQIKDSIDKTTISIERTKKEVEEKKKKIEGMRKKTFLEKLLRR